MTDLDHSRMNRLLVYSLHPNSCFLFFPVKVFSCEDEEMQEINTRQEEKRVGKKVSLARKPTKDSHLELVT
jgi:hypothetical protein